VGSESKGLKGWVMRTLFGFWIFAAVLTLIGASVAIASPSVGVGAEAVATSTTPPVAQRVNFNNTGIRDEAAMVLVGTILIGIAGAVRRAA
jgi:cell division protein FtsX